MALFEWDEKKNKANEKKHGFTLEDATNVFDDPDRIQYIASKGNERRFITVGKVIKFIVAVVYTVRAGMLRIISARQARKNEINDYLENKLKKKGNA
ncbi:MAG: BrnT family toxin [Haliscomenobacter sp.]|nr:BrnT family toxin [Haliscomenobacter sp.]